MLSRLLLIAIVMITISGCKEDDNSPKSIFDGITVTTACGGVISVDTNDWRATNTIKDIKVYPNPIMPNDSTTLVFTIKKSAQCKVWIIDNDGFSKTILDAALAAGIHVYTIKGLTKERIYRIYIQANKEKTYGDVWVRYPED